jgi:carbonic anhydrase
MMKLFFYLSLVLMAVLLITDAVIAESWNYEDPDSWSDTYANCGGTRQSPVNIDIKTINKNLRLRLAFNNFEVKPLNMSWFNNGHTAVLRSTYNIANRPSVTNLENGETYIVDAVHYHWGPNNCTGSEHTVNGYSFPVEMHMVCWNQRYGSLSAAVPSSNGLLVLGSFFTISESFKGNTHLDYLLDIVAANTEFKIPLTLSTRELLVRTPKKYYFYSGSLTTPTCDETVQWVVIQKPLRITSQHLSYFRRLLDANEVRITENYRPVQLLYGRQIGFN